MRKIDIRSTSAILRLSGLSASGSPTLVGGPLPCTAFEGAVEDGRSPRRGGTPIRKDSRESGIVADIGIRALGLAAIVISIMLFSWLHAGMQSYPASEASIGQLAIIAVAFLGTSVGCGLVALGRHIHDRIEVAERWRRRL